MPYIATYNCINIEAIMKFTVNSTNLLKLTQIVNGAVSTNHYFQILENLLFEISDGILTITGSDMQNTLMATMAIESDRDGSICIPAKLFLDTLKNLPEQPLTFLIDEDTFAIEIVYENGKAKLSGENAIDFPRVPEADDTDSVTTTGDALSSAINATLFCTSSDDLRPAMGGVLVEFGEKYTTFVATDGHRLVRYRRMDVVNPTGISYIIPKKALSLLKGTLPSDATPVHVAFTSNNAIFTYNNVKMICRLIDERYPDYSAAIPTANPFELIVQRTELLASLQVITLYTNRTTHQVRMKIDDQQVTLSAEDIDFQHEAVQTLTAEYTGDPMEIGFNATYLLDMLKATNSNMVTIQLAAPNKPGLILPKAQAADEDNLMLLMPVMLSQYA